MRLDPERRHDAVVNVQGDLPMLDPAAIRTALAGLADPETDIATLAAVIEDDAALADTSVNKVVAGFADPARPARALYFSKAVVPWGDGPHYEHIGLYAYRRAALERFVGAAARRARTARAARTVARARSRHAHLGQPDRGRPARRAGRHSGRSRTRPPIDATDDNRDDGDRKLEPADPARTIAFQGAFGAYSDLACRRVFPEMATLPCAQFEDAFAAVREGRARLAMIPIENSVAGRVADIHHLMPDSGLHIIGEHFEPVNHHLLALPGASLAQIRTVRSHVHALSQCRKLIRALGIEPIVAADTAGAAAEIAARGDPTVAAIASELAGQIYGLVSLKENIEDAEHNTTRFLIMSREAMRPPRGDAVGHDIFVPRAQRAGGALQGLGRVRHQRRQHDQARKLHGRRRLYRDAVLRRCRGASRGPAAGLGARGTRLFFARGQDPRRLPRPSAAHRGLGAAE